MRRTYLYFGLVVSVTALALTVWRTSAGAPHAASADSSAGERSPSGSLPLGQVVLFTSGVGYFQRQGEVEGDARIDLEFPAADINDLLKSLVLQDQGRGKIASISYDGQEPIERTLQSFALDLTSNPTFGQLLNQARGEKIEVTLQNAAGTLTGTIVGMESRQEPGPREVHRLNLLGAEGMRSLPLDTVQRVRFLNAALDRDVRRALEVLAGSHNNQKKRVSLQFDGDGKRMVKVGYVVEAPLWKSSYRLAIDKAGKITLQGWAIVENTTEEDWKDVRLALVASRPISFQMDLYPPLYVPRPIVEPERFAALRPEEYQGPLLRGQGNVGGIGMMGMGGFNGIAGVAGMGGLGGQGFQNIGGSGQGGFQGQLQGQGNLGFGGGFQGAAFNRYQMGVPGTSAAGVNRLTYEQLQERRKEREQAKAEAKKTGQAIAELDPIGSIRAAGQAETIGDQARYTIDHPIRLARQRSLLLPLVNREVAGRRVSIFNEKVYAKHPLLGLKLQNTTGQLLQQGPVAIYEAGSYAGDARLPDLQDKEERLLSFAVDQAVEVKSETKSTPEELTTVRLVKGIVEETHRQRQTTIYLIKNRSGQERSLIVEHPVERDWKLIGSEKPAERSRDYYRFEWKAAAGQSLVREVVRERTRRGKTHLLSMSEKDIDLLLRSSASSEKLREALRQAIALKKRLEDALSDVENVRGRLQAVIQEQQRVRSTLDKVPANSPIQKRYLQKLDQQETEIEKLQAQIEDKRSSEKKQQKELEKYLAGLSVD